MPRVKNAKQGTAIDVSDTGQAIKIYGRLTVHALEGNWRISSGVPTIMVSEGAVQTVVLWGNSSTPAVLDVVALGTSGSAEAFYEFIPISAGS